MRIGHGYDAHRLTDGWPLVLGGVTIPYEKGLLGHSDADVLTHAVMDALLGAAGLGDVGRHFPDSDPSLHGISSLILLQRVAGLLSEKGYQTVNIDAVIVAEQPKLSPYLEEMRERLSVPLGLPSDCINIKATTEERMGFTGAGQGMSAHAVALIWGRGIRD